MINGISSIPTYGLYTNPYNNSSAANGLSSNKVEASSECKTCQNRK